MFPQTRQVQNSTFLHCFTISLVQICVWVVCELEHKCVFVPTCTFARRLHGKLCTRRMAFGPLRSVSMPVFTPTACYIARARIFFPPLAPEFIALLFGDFFCLNFPTFGTVQVNIRERTSVTMSSLLRRLRGRQQTNSNDSANGSASTIQSVDNTLVISIDDDSNHSSIVERIEHFARMFPRIFGVLFCVLLHGDCC